MRISMACPHIIGIRNAIRSLFAQTYQEWELIIVNDGCTDNTEEFISDYLKNSRVTYLKNDDNKGIGTSINRAINCARYDYIAYLPSDDFYYTNHLEVVASYFHRYPDAVLVTTVMKSELCDSLLNKRNVMVNGFPFGLSLQMVQSVHRKTEERWVERSEWESVNLYDSFFNKLYDKGLFIRATEVTCHWQIHPIQRHKILSESLGGNVNRYRQHYNVKSPLKIKVSEHRFLDEEKAFADYRKEYSKAHEGLKILLVGELSYNHERIVALQEAGHQLYGLWTQTPAFSFSNVGPLPFGNIIDIDYNHWEDEIRRIGPDIIYALTNFCSVPIAHEVLEKNLGIPFVWHFKEGPFLCFEHEYWQKLVDIYVKADGVIFLNDAYKDWICRYFQEPSNSLIMDGDLTKQDYFKESFRQKLSDIDGEIHTVISGRAVGITVDDIEALSKHNIHLHWYNESYEESYLKFVSEASKIAPYYFHVHNHCGPCDWTNEFSQYDAGWLHVFDSSNYGDLDKVTWNDLNLPARISTMMAAGIPSIQKDNGLHIVAMQSCIKAIDCGIFFKNINDLARQLKDSIRMHELTNNVMKHRVEFSFDYHVPELVSFFMKTIKLKNNEKK